MKLPILLVLIVQLWCASLGAAKDFALIEKLPQRLAQLHSESRSGWASGVTADMKNATYHYNDGLTAMIKELAHAYFPEDYFAEGSVDDYVKALYTLRHFRQDATNPDGERQGTMGGLEVTGEVSADLEEMVADMVKAITSTGPKFNYSGWKKKWQQSKK